MKFFSNLFANLKLMGKVTKIIKDVKNFLDSTHLDEDLKENVENIIKSAKFIVSKVPDLKNAYLNILEILKK